MLFYPLYKPALILELCAPVRSNIYCIYRTVSIYFVYYEYIRCILLGAPLPSPSPPTSKTTDKQQQPPIPRDAAGPCAIFNHTAWSIFDDPPFPEHKTDSDDDDDDDYEFTRHNVWPPPPQVRPPWWVDDRLWNLNLPITDEIPSPSPSPPAPPKMKRKRRYCQFIDDEALTEKGHVDNNNDDDDDENSCGLIDPDDL